MHGLIRNWWIGLYIFYKQLVYSLLYIRLKWNFTTHKNNNNNTHTHARLHTHTPARPHACLVYTHIRAHAYTHTFTKRRIYGVSWFNSQLNESVLVIIKEYRNAWKYAQNHWSPRNLKPPIFFLVTPLHTIHTRTTHTCTHNRVYLICEAHIKLLRLYLHVRQHISIRQWSSHWRLSFFVC